MDATTAAGRRRDNLLLAAAFVAAHGVDVVVVGGCALRLHGHDHDPADLDLVPAPGLENLHRLLDALDLLGNVSRAPRPSDHALATASILTRTTPIGSIDVLLQRGRDEYDTLARAGGDVDVRGHPTRVASLADVLRLREQFGAGTARA